MPGRASACRACPSTPYSARTRLTDLTWTNLPRLASPPQTLPYYATPDLACRAISHSATPHIASARLADQISPGLACLAIHSRGASFASSFGMPGGIGFSPFSHRCQLLADISNSRAAALTDSPSLCRSSRRDSPVSLRSMTALQFFDFFEQLRELLQVLVPLLERREIGQRVGY